VHHNTVAQFVFIGSELDGFLFKLTKEHDFIIPAINVCDHG